MALTNQYYFRHKACLLAEKNLSPPAIENNKIGINLKLPSVNPDKIVTVVVIEKK